MTRVLLRGMVLAFFALFYVAPAWADANQSPRGLVTALPWQTSAGKIGSVAQFTPRGDLRFLDATATSRFLELNGNPPRPNNYTVAPTTMNWFAVFSFNPIGYVRDDQTLDPDQLLRTLQRQNEAGAAERRRLGFPVLTLQGWAVTPHYDGQTRQLEWGTRLTAEDGGTTVNYSIRLLGRTGVMSAVLVSDPASLETNVQQFKTSLRNFSFLQGEQYAEFRQGDHIAEYGLAALIVGGAAAAAASSGAMKGLGKLVMFGALAAFAAVGGFFKRLFGGGKRPQT
jgi:uncharacterized membrane-anchored protein